MLFLLVLVLLLDKIMSIWRSVGERGGRGWMACIKSWGKAWGVVLGFIRIHGMLALYYRSLGGVLGEVGILYLDRYR